MAEGFLKTVDQGYKSHANLQLNVQYPNLHFMLSL